MRSPSAALSLAVALLSLASCRCASGALSHEDLAANRALNRQFVAFVLASDWDAASRLYAESAVLLPPNMPRVEGRAAIRDFLAAFPPLAAFDVTDDAVEVSGDLAYAHGRYTMTLAVRGSPVDKGKYVDVRRRQPDGSWRYVADMFSSDLPPATSP